MGLCTWNRIGEKTPAASGRASAFQRLNPGEAGASPQLLAYQVARDASSVLVVAALTLVRTPVLALPEGPSQRYRCPLSIYCLYSMARTRI